MSYDLDFWKYKKDTYLNNQKVYEKCSEEEIAHFMTLKFYNDMIENKN